MTPDPRSRCFHVLLAEDNLEDVFLTKTCFAGLPYSVTLHHVENGEDCLAFLQKSGRFADAPSPDLVLLDLNMPRVDGRETMARIAADPTLKRLPVVILTTSAEDEDVTQMYDLRCSSYIVKSLNFQPFQTAMKRLADYWFSVVTLPDRSQG